jgi:hypothetical protein
MKELNEYRRHLMDKLVSVVKEFRVACLAVEEPFAPLTSNGWNVHQIATHTRDVHMLVYRFRAQRTAEDENPEFQNFDGDAYMAEHYDKTKPLKKVLDGFVASVESLQLILERLPAEAWSRTSRHALLGDGFTLQTWVERDLAHIEEHLEAIKKSS